jgi:tetratricopeptide (TPR) repeat protein
MSENAGTSVNTRKSYVKILLLTLAVIVPLFVYGAGVLVLPFSAQIIFQNKNCDLGLNLYKVYASLYPEFIRDASLAGPVQECEAYVLATSNENDENWRSAYDAYQDYLSAYPSGLYAGEAYEHSAVTLMSIAKEQAEQKEYAEAVKNLNQLVSSYSDTNVSAESWTLFSSTYTAWGSDLREADDFERSEQVLNDFKTASLNYQQVDPTTEAERQLAQTYLAWGLNLQSQKQREDALAKFNLAVSVDSQAQFDSTEQAKSSQRKLYIEWGDDLLEQKQFPAAMEKFALAVSQAEGEKDDGAKDALVNGRIQWAADLSHAEDFTGALEQLKSAKQAAASDPSVEKALQDTYLAFSKSSGRQARIAIKEALETICKKHDEPDLRIFGLDKDSVRFGIYGVEDRLPEDLAARTPGEMHYVVCITTDNRTVESRQHKNIVLKVSRGYYYTLVEQFRVQMIWNVELLNVETGRSVAEQTLTGELPPPFSEVGGNYFYGKAPMEEFKTWLQSAIP